MDQTDSTPVDAGNPPAIADAIDAAHADLVARIAEGASPAPTAAPVAEDGATVAAAPAGHAGDNHFVEELALLVLQRHNAAVRREFEEPLAKLCGADTAGKFGERAAMSEKLQGDVAMRLQRIAEKYDVAKFLNDESALIALGLAHWWNLQELRKERDALLRQHTQPESKQ